MIYTKTKIFHFKEKIDSLPKTIDKIMPPVHIRIKPTNICNHNCAYCAYRAENLKMFRKDTGHNTNFIQKEKMMEIIDDIITLGVKAVTFSGGGEPFIYPYLLPVIKELSKSPVRFASLTNGSRLEGELAEVFAKCGTWVRVSVDGWDEESYSLYRKVPRGEFTKVITNMKNFKRLEGKCYLGVSLIVDRNNASHIYELLQGLKDIGVDSAKISPCLVSDDRAENNKYFEPILSEVKRQMAKAMKELADKEFEIFDGYSELEKKFQKDYTWCPYIQILPVIGADLNIYSCPDKAYNLEKGLIGSIKNQRFKDFWVIDKNKFFKINPLVDCSHHCETDPRNRLVLEYLNADKEHLNFV